MALALRWGAVLRASPSRGEDCVFGLLPGVDVSVGVEELLSSALTGDELREGRHVANAMIPYSCR